MMDFRVEAAISEIARREGSSRRAVLREMQITIDEGFRNPDPSVQAAWAKIPYKGSKPTPQEVIAHLASMDVLQMRN